MALNENRDDLNEKKKANATQAARPAALYDRTKNGRRFYIFSANTGCFNKALKPVRLHGLLFHHVDLVTEDKPVQLFSMDGG